MFDEVHHLIPAEFNKIIKYEMLHLRVAYNIDAYHPQ